MTVLVTGANGFVGRALVATLLQSGHTVLGTVRHSHKEVARDIGIECLAVGDVGPDTDWSLALRKVDTIVHLVARTHVMRQQAGDSLSLYRNINVGGTRRLVWQAASAGIRRFVFVSSIKVNGERTFGRPFHPNDRPAPEDHYGTSKGEAEDVLHDIASVTGMETVVVRPPLVYGPGVQGNFLRLMVLVSKGLPLPLGSVKNRRSMVARDNLVDLLVRCIDAPPACDRTFLVSDAESLSTPQLIRCLGTAMGRPARLIPVPPAALRLLGQFTGRTAEVARLCDSLEVDDSETRRLLDWQPPVSVHDAIRATVEHFARTK